LRADNATKALADGNAANAAQIKALSASLSFALSNSAFAPAPGNFNVNRATTGTGTLFHKMQAKSIKPLAVTPNVIGLITFIRSVEKLATNTAQPCQDPLGAITAYAEDTAHTPVPTFVTLAPTTRAHVGYINYANTVVNRLRRALSERDVGRGPLAVEQRIYGLGTQVPYRAPVL
jgi:hypothetical protein